MAEPVDKRQFPKIEASFKELPQDAEAELVEQSQERRSNRDLPSREMAEPVERVPQPPTDQAILVAGAAIVAALLFCMVMFLVAG
jgi:hypothetical protein